MAFIVEDGTGYPNSNSFATVQFFVDYCTDRGYTVQAGWAQARIQGNLVKATDELNMRYGQRFSGRIVQPNIQALCFPRRECYRKQNAQDDRPLFYWSNYNNLLPPNVVPEEVQKAVCELALVADGEDLTPSVDADSFNTVGEEIGPLKTNYTRRKKLSRNLHPRVGYLLAPYLQFSGNQIPMSRG